MTFSRRLSSISLPEIFSRFGITHLQQVPYLSNVIFAVI